MSDPKPMTDKVIRVVEGSARAAINGEEGWQTSTDSMPINPRLLLSLIARVRALEAEAATLRAERDRLRKDRDRFEVEARKHQTFKHRYDDMLDEYERRTGIDREDVFEAIGHTDTAPSGAKESDDDGD